MITNVNALASAAKPEIGMPCTINYWSDCDPAEIVEIKGKSIFIRCMDAKVIRGSGHDGSAEYEYSSNPDNGIREFTLRKNGRYYPKGSTMKSGNPLSLGFARKYRDPSF